MPKAFLDSNLHQTLLLRRILSYDCNSNVCMRQVFHLGFEVEVGYCSSVKGKVAISPGKWK